MQSVVRCFGFEGGMPRQDVGNRAQLGFLCASRAKFVSAGILRITVPSVPCAGHRPVIPEPQAPWRADTFVLAFNLRTSLHLLTILRKGELVIMSVWSRE